MYSITMNNLLGKGRKDSSYEAYTKYLEVKLTRYIQSRPSQL